MATLALTLAPARPRTAARVAFQVGCAVAGSLLIAGLAQIQIPWLHHALPGLTGKPATWGFTLGQGLYPFIVGDTIKLLLAACLLPGAWQLLRRARPEGV